ncbi:MAG: hypothetical protein KGJ12_04570 [Gammaproteobacteria bacterium]|nr:hypothetical protein [Gammaproteobacteria bacterium]
MHAELIRLGFPAYVRAVKAACAERLFPGVVRSDGVTDWFTGHVEMRRGKTEAMQDLHSFRHTFKTAARNAGITRSACARWLAVCPCLSAACSCSSVLTFPK